MVFNLRKAIPDIPPKNYNCLIRNGITTYEALADMTDEDISRLKGVHDIKGLSIVRDRARYYRDFLMEQKKGATMKDAFEKIRKRIKEVKSYGYCSECGHRTICDKVEKECGGEDLCGATMRDIALSIVSEVEAEYGNGWIPCSGCKDCEHKECEHHGKV